MHRCAAVARPDASSSMSSASLRSSSSRWWVPKSRIWKPVTEIPLSSTRLSGMRGISPAAKPTVTNLPP